MPQASSDKIHSSSTSNASKGSKSRTSSPSHTRGRRHVLHTTCYSYDIIAIFCSVVYLLVALRRSPHSREQHHAIMFQHPEFAIVHTSTAPAENSSKPLVNTYQVQGEQKSNTFIISTNQRLPLHIQACLQRKTPPNIPTTQSTR